jgi:hypothetical protein
LKKKFAAQPAEAAFSLHLLPIILSIFMSKERKTSGQETGANVDFYFNFLLLLTQGTNMSRTSPTKVNRQRCRKLMYLSSIITGPVGDDEDGGDALGWKGWLVVGIGWCRIRKIGPQGVYIEPKFIKKMLRMEQRQQQQCFERCC